MTKFKMLARHLQFSQRHIPNTLWHLIYPLITHYNHIDTSFVGFHSMERIMDVYTPPTGRADFSSIALEVNTVNNSQILNEFLGFTTSIITVLNEHRQILAVNDSFLTLSKSKELPSLLGLRPGEAINCVNWDKGLDGCGTSSFCPSCGMAKAISTSLQQKESVTEKCAFTLSRNSHQENLFFRIEAKKIVMGDQTIILLFMQDITNQQWWANLERVFFHDISNVISALLGFSELLVLLKDEPKEDIIYQVNKSATRLAKEVAIQQVLLQTEPNHYKLRYEQVSLEKIVQDIKDIFLNNPVAKGITFHTSEEQKDQVIKTDLYLLLKILTNMVKNALEATSQGGVVKFWIEKGDKDISFFVWNKESMPEVIAKRVFQRNFSTKQGEGRGLGTYSMKLFAESILRGKINFKTSDERGTIFRLELPLT